MNTRRAAIDFGAPVFVPGVPASDWAVAGYHGDQQQRPVSVFVMGPTGSVTTSDLGEPQSLIVDVMNVISGSVRSDPDLTLPLSVTVTERTSVLHVDGDSYPCRVLETGSSWQAKASVDGRVLTAGGVGETPARLEFVSVTDLHALPDARFR